MTIETGALTNGAKVKAIGAPVPFAKKEALSSLMRRVRSMSAARLRFRHVGRPMPSARSPVDRRADRQFAANCSGPAKQLAPRSAATGRQREEPRIPAADIDHRTTLHWHALEATAGRAADARHVKQPTGDVPAALLFP